MFSSDAVNLMSSRDERLPLVLREVHKTPKIDHNSQQFDSSVQDL